MRKHASWIGGHLGQIDAKGQKLCQYPAIDEFSCFPFLMAFESPYIQFVEQLWKALAFTNVSRPTEALNLPVVLAMKSQFCSGTNEEDLAYGTSWYFRSYRKAEPSHRKDRKYFYAMVYSSRGFKAQPAVHGRPSYAAAKIAEVKQALHDFLNYGAAYH